MAAAGWRYSNECSGNGFDGTMLNGLSGASHSVAGRIGTALDTEASSNHWTNVPHNAAFDGLLEITAAMWIKRESINLYSPLLAKTSSGGDYPITFEICYTGAGACGAGEDNKLSLYSNKTTPAQMVSTATITDSNWHHVAVTRKNNGADTTVTFYIDGVSSGATTVNTNNYGTATLPIRLGKESSGLSSFDGVLDDIRFYGRALTGAEIAQLYNLGVKTRICNTNACSNPSGAAGDMIYNATSNVMQYCNSGSWLAIGK